jgi:hypothetical protein
MAFYDPVFSGDDIEGLESLGIYARGGEEVKVN